MSTRSTRPADVAVVGAGISGLACARALAESGQHVRVFDKARGPGGRMSTRRADAMRFDHGAQYFTARDPAFAAFLAPLIEDGVVARWDGRIATLENGIRTAKEDNPDRYVGVPGMSAVCRRLAEGLDVAYAARVTALARKDDGWHLRAEDGSDLGRCDTLVVSAPPAQTAQLLGPHAPALAARAAAVPMSPCWAVMAALENPLELGFDGAFVDDAPLSWVARNNSKPGRPAQEAWVLHASPAWSKAHVDMRADAVRDALWRAFSEAAGGIAARPTHLTAHRWIYALPEQPLAETALYDPALAIAACGDWCAGPRVEGAWRSGRAAAARILGATAGAAE